MADAPMTSDVNGASSVPPLRVVAAQFTNAAAARRVGQRDLLRLDAARALCQHTGVADQLQQSVDKRAHERRQHHFLRRVGFVAVIVVAIVDVVVVIVVLVVVVVIVVGELVVLRAVVRAAAVDGRARRQRQQARHPG